MTRFDVQQGHHGFFGKKSRDDKNLFEQNSYLTKKIHSNFHTILHNVGIYWIYRRKSEKHLTIIKIYLSVLLGYIYENPSVLFFFVKPTSPNW